MNGAKSATNAYNDRLPFLRRLLILDWTVHLTDYPSSSFAYLSPSLILQTPEGLSLKPTIFSGF